MTSFKYIDKRTTKHKLVKAIVKPITTKTINKKGNVIQNQWIKLSQYSSNKTYQNFFNKYDQTSLAKSLIARS
jgi:hypothetical protein